MAGYQAKREHLTTELPARRNPPLSGFFSYEYEGNMPDAKTIKVPLKNGGFALVDEGDSDLVDGRIWRVFRYSKGRPTAVVSGSTNKKRVFLHRLIAKPGNGMVVDHINGDPLDNRRKNLRICTQSENLRNRKIHSNNQSGYKGVQLDKRRGKYRAQIVVDGKRIRSKYFDTPEDAHHVYCQMSEELHGEFSRVT